MRPKSTQLFFISFCILLFISCAASKKYTYNFLLQQPVASKELAFKNDTLAVAFQFNSRFIDMEIENLLNEGIKINWDEVSISVNGIAKRAIRYDKYNYIKKSIQPPTTIPPQSKLKEQLVSSDNVYYLQDGNNNYSGVAESYPKYDYGKKKRRARILKLKGQKIILYLPYYIQNKFHSKTFEFFIEDIVEEKI